MVTSYNRRIIVFFWNVRFERFEYPSWNKANIFIQVRK